MTVVAVLGGVEITAPPGVPIECLLFGGKSDERSVGRRLAGCPVVRLRVFCLFGGVKVKERNQDGGLKRTLGEKGTVTCGAAIIGKRNFRRGSVSLAAGVVRQRQHLPAIVAACLLAACAIAAPTRAATRAVLVKDIDPGRASALQTIQHGLVASRGRLFFAARDRTHGVELWRSNGGARGTVLVKDIRPGPDGSAPGDLTDVNGTLFFTAADRVTAASCGRATAPPPAPSLSGTSSPGAQARCRSISRT